MRITNRIGRTNARGLHFIWLSSLALGQADPYNLPLALRKDQRYRPPVTTMLSSRVE